MSSWSRALVLTLGLALSLVACHPARVLVVVPDALTHDIGRWADADLLCVALTPRESLYITRRCIPMKTIRALILQTRIAGVERSLTGPVAF